MNLRISSICYLYQLLCTPAEFFYVISTNLIHLNFTSLINHAILINLSSSIGRAAKVENIMERERKTKYAESIAKKIIWKLTFTSISN